MTTMTLERTLSSAARILCAGLLALTLATAASAQTSQAKSERAAPPAAPATPSAAAAAAAASDYVVLSMPLAAESAADLIEVVELFWYGCPHCFALEPALAQWTAGLPKDVRVRRLPAVLTDSWEPAARLFYTLEALGQVERLHGAVFDAEHNEGSLRVQSRDEQKFAAWAEKQGIAKAEFIAAWLSPAVAGKVDQATRQTLPFRRVGVPALIVDGRFLTTATLAGTPQGLLATAERLIAQVRAERAGKLR